MNYSPDRFGHWIVSGQKYSNKLRAIKDAVNIGHWIHWDFNEAIFKQYDWTIEPKESLIELYNLRAKQIREKYKYVALEFSGGADSWNMLAAFCRQGLKVDLVIHKVIESTIKSIENLDSTNHWAEGKYSAWTWFNYFKTLVPDLEWFTWDFEEQLYDSWDRNKIDLEFNNTLHPGALVKFPGMTDINPAKIPELPSTAYLVGIDKPIVELHPDGWYLIFYDHHVISRAVIEKAKLGVGWTDLFFYWDPDCVKLMMKQAHTIRNFFRSHPDLGSLLLSAGPRAWNYKTFISHVIYPGYKQLWQSKKPRGTFAFTCEEYFINQTDKRASQEWHKVMNDYQDTVISLTKNTAFEAYTHNDPGSASYKVFADCPSHRYFIGPP